MVIKREPVQPKTPGQLIRAYRLERGINLEQMAEFLCCSKSELSQIENGHKSISRMKQLLWSCMVPHWTPHMLQSDEPR